MRTIHTFFHSSCTNYIPQQCRRDPLFHILTITYYFMDLLGICMSSLGECLLRSSARLSLGFFFLFFCYQVVWVLYILWIPALYITYITCSYFLPFTSVLFSFYCQFPLLWKSFYKKCIYFELEDNCFTVLCYFLPYINMNQP